MNKRRLTWLIVKLVVIVVIAFFILKVPQSIQAVLATIASVHQIGTALLRAEE